MGLTLIGASVLGVNRLANLQCGVVVYGTDIKLEGEKGEQFSHLTDKSRIPVYTNLLHQVVFCNSAREIIICLLN